MLKLNVDLAPLMAAIERFRQFATRLKPHLRKAMGDSVGLVQKGATERVHILSGALARSITTSVKANARGGFTGRVESKKDYAGIEEHGFIGTENVKAYARRLRGGDVREHRKLVASGLGYVRAHTRQVNRPAHPFLGPSLDAAADGVQGFHADAVQATIDEGA
jgi:hypothetical protein